MKNKNRLRLLTTVLIAAATVSATAQTAGTSDLDQLKAAMQTMQKNMEQMQQKIAELEKEKAETSQAQSSLEKSSPSIKTMERAAAGQDIGHASPVAERFNLNDQQIAAPRAGCASEKATARRRWQVRGDQDFPVAVCAAEVPLSRWIHKISHGFTSSEC